VRFCSERNLFDYVYSTYTPVRFGTIPEKDNLFRASKSVYNPGNSRMEDGSIGWQPVLSGYYSVKNKKSSQKNKKANFRGYFRQ
jgi:hypothetical protein